MRFVTSGVCARAASGNAVAAPPSEMMKSRRLMTLPLLPIYPGRTEAILFVGDSPLCITAKFSDQAPLRVRLDRLVEAAWPLNVRFPSNTDRKFNGPLSLPLCHSRPNASHAQ